MTSYEEPIATRGGKITLETCVNQQYTQPFGAQPFSKPSMPTGTTFGTTAGFGGGVSGNSFGTSFGAPAVGSFGRPTMSSFNAGGFGAAGALGGTNAQLEPPSPFDDLLQKMYKYYIADQAIPAHEIDISKLTYTFKATEAIYTRFRCSSQVNPSLTTLDRCESAVLRFSNDYGSAEFLGALQVSDLPSNLDELCFIEPGKITINSPSRVLCCLRGVEAEGETNAERETYMRDLSRQSGVEFVQYFAEDGVWVFRK